MIEPLRPSSVLFRINKWGSSSCCQLQNTSQSQPHKHTQTSENLLPVQRGSRRPVVLQWNGCWPQTRTPRHSGKTRKHRGGKKWSDRITQTIYFIYYLCFYMDILLALYYYLSVISSSGDFCPTSIDPKKWAKSQVITHVYSLLFSWQLGFSQTGNQAITSGKGK